MNLSLLGATAAAAATLAAAAPASAQTSCPRPVEGSVVTQPKDLYSSNGTLSVDLTFMLGQDQYGRSTFCFQMPDGTEAPTLHVNPGDRLVLNLTNGTSENAKVPPSAMAMSMNMSRDTGTKCGAANQLGYTVNMHFHGANLPPTCHQDEVIRTFINPGHTFTYSTVFPRDEPSGLYWYHPHIHGLSNITVLGGATGALVVDGIQNLAPEVAKLPARTLVLRDQNTVNGGADSPSWDVSVNYVPINYPEYTPAIIKMKSGAREFWRVANTSADTIMDVQLVYDGVPQPLKVVAQDAVVLGSQDGTRTGRPQTVTDMFLPPASRAEFIVTGPGAGVTNAQFVTKAIDGGPFGDINPARPLATIQQSDGGTDALPVLPAAAPGQPGPGRFDGIDTAKVTAHRHLYFYEIGTPRGKTRGNRNGQQGGPPWGDGLFYIVVDGQQPQVYNPDAPPSIVTQQGAVEDWTIENRTPEVHEFHMHQIHFQMRELNGTLLPANGRKMLDVVNVPYWPGSGPYPSVTLRMDFRGHTVGDFVYHCHILGHEDAGMMAIIRVKPSH